MKENKREVVLTTLLCLLPILAGVLLYRRLPETMAVHFGPRGEANGWASRPFAVFALPAILAGINLLLHFSLRTDPKKQNMSPALRAVAVWTIPVLSILLYALTLLNALGYPAHIETVTPLLVGLLLVIIGNYMPKTKQSYTMGIKLPWTLASEENWNRTHRLAGYLWVLGGLVIVLLTLLHIWSPWLFLGLVAALVLVPTVYSYLLYRKGV